MTLAGVRGGLITTSFALTELPRIPAAGTPPVDFFRDIEAWSARRETGFGPSSSVRAIADGLLTPLLKILGFLVGRRVDRVGTVRLDVCVKDRPAATVLIAPWGESLDAEWRTTILDAIDFDARWCFCSNGTVLRIVDAHRTWSRQYVEFDLALLADERETSTLLWRLARGESMSATPPFLDRAVELSAHSGRAVRRRLAAGVLEALRLLLGACAGRHKHPWPDLLLEQSLTVVYRVLFLLFAEARGLVPIWHPIYRDRYTIESIVTTLLAGRRYRGVWLAVNAISRLAYAGCTAGELKVTAFNGRLFSPSGIGPFDRCGIRDDVMGEAILAVSTMPPAHAVGRHRIDYRELDVEELGAVYEHILDYESSSDRSASPLQRTRDVRKATGTFYTPRSLTAWLVREALSPLISGRSGDEILKLRILDPAMGSGAFLVEACVQLAGAVEEAFVREGRWHRGDVTAADRIMLRREIAQRCLFGVDLNPTAVQVARLSLWLTTLSADKPLSFLDHRLVTGNSLIGATPDDIRRQPTGAGRRGSRVLATPLFDQSELTSVLGQAVTSRERIASQPDDSASVVRAKERALAAVHAPDGLMGRWARCLDLWCAGWFWTGSAPLNRATFHDLVDLLLNDRCTLPKRFAESLLATAGSIAARDRFLHWPVAFPEVFSDEGGEPLANPGFDAVIGNPPWDMVRGDSGESTVRTARQEQARRLAAFVRESGVYRLDTRGHANRYQLFVERMLQLARQGGRIALVLPAGSVTDAGSAPLRRHLFERAQLDAIIGFDNRNGIFPIHRGVRFVLLTATSGESTQEVRCRFGISRAERVDEPDVLEPPSGVTLTRAFLTRLSGADDLALPEIQSGEDLRILERMTAQVPGLGSSSGWNVAFGRELNATDDRHLFVPVEHQGGRCVLEGKQIEPFRTSMEGCRYRLRPNARVVIPRRPRLAYRDVASATNRLTLIAAIVPADAVTTHTLSCLKTDVAFDVQLVLCALLNSFVANYVVRFKVNTHVTVSLVSRLPVPYVGRDSGSFARLASLARTLMHSPTIAEEQPEYWELQARVARLYGLAAGGFRHVLSTFPLIPESVRTHCQREFDNLH